MSKSAEPSAEWTDSPIVIGTTNHPAYDAGAEFHSGTIVQMLQVGDKIVWEDRATPMTVIEESPDRYTSYTDGMNLEKFMLEGLQGGQCSFTNWLHWDGEEQSRTNPDGLWPQIRRQGTDKSDGDLLTHCKSGLGIVTEEPWYLISDAVDHPIEDWGLLVYQKPMQDRPQVAEVRDVEFGQPTVREIRFPHYMERKDASGLVHPREQSEIEKTIDLEHIRAVRVGGQ